MREIWMLGFKEAVYRRYEPDNFARKWLKDNGINTAIVNDFRSAMKLEELVKRNKVTVGGELYLPDQAGRTDMIQNRIDPTLECLRPLNHLTKQMDVFKSRVSWRPATSATMNLCICSFASSMAPVYRVET